MSSQWNAVSHEETLRIDGGWWYRVALWVAKMGAAALEGGAVVMQYDKLIRDRDTAVRVAEHPQSDTAWAAAARAANQ